MPDIFNRTTDSFGGALSADSAKLTFPALAGNESTAGFLIQNLGGQFSQQVTRVYEVGSNQLFYVAGRAAGDLNIARIVGPRKISAAFFRRFGDVCQARGNAMDLSAVAGCDTGDLSTRASYTMHFCVANRVGLSMAAQDNLINEQLGVMFSSMLYS